MTINTKSYKYEIFDGHIIFKIDNKVALLDTGGRSTGNENLDFMGNLFKLNGNFLGITIEEISNFVGIHLDILFGLDIISQFDLLIDAENSTLVFSYDDIDIEGTSTYLSESSIIKSYINQENIEVFFDTGAKISYIHSDYVVDKYSSVTMDDFFPSYGKFKTKVYELETEIAGESFTLDYGVLPQYVEDSLLGTRINGIIGTELLKRFNCLLSFRNNKMTLQRRNLELIQTFQKLVNDNACTGSWGLGVCTTCGCMETEKKLMKIKNLEEELLNIDIESIKGIDYSNTHGYNRMEVYVTYLVFLFLRVKSIDKQKVLYNWLDNIDEKYVELLDGILFYVIRYIEDSDLRNKWIKKCEIIADKTMNYSLMESLYYVKRKDVK